MRLVYTLAAAGAMALVGLGGCAGPGGGSGPGAEAPIRDVAASAALLKRAQEAVAQREIERAAELLGRSIEADPFNAKALNNRGVLAMEAGDLPSAARDFAAAARLLPDDPRPRVNLGLALAAGGQPERAIEAFREALSREAGHVGAMTGVVRTQLRWGLEDGETAELLRRLQRVAPDERWAEQLERLGG